MRAESKLSRIIGQWFVASFMVCLVGSLYAQVPPQKSRAQRPGVIELSKKVPDPPDEKSKPQKAAAKGGMADHRGMMENMRNHMGPYTPRELYPSLMHLPDLSPEKREEIKRFAVQRMDAGLRMFTQGRVALAEATKRKDFSSMEQNASEMQAGVARYESGLAALTALEAGEGPQQIALSWFRSEMNLDPSLELESNTMILGMTPFHSIICALMTLLIAASVWMYFLRMRRVATLIQHLLQPTTSSSLATQAVTFSPASSLAQQETTAKVQQTTWSGDLRVAATFMETLNVKTFRLVDPANAVIPFQYLPGQFLRLSLEIDGKSIKRPYTIASTPTRNRYIEITVKRETHGSVSQYLHDRVEVGDLMHVTAPSGNFTFTGMEHDSIVLIGGGVGITPLMSVVRALTDIGWNKEIYFLYTCQTPEEYIFREELDYLQDRNPNLKLVVTFSRATDEIKDFHRGRITKELISKSVPHIAARRVHICGTPSMMQSVKEMLKDLGVSTSNIKLEAFGTSKRMPGAIEKGKVVPQGDAAVVTFSRSHKSGSLLADTPILEAAEAIDVDIDYACRSGMCGTCKVRLNSGSVTMEVEEALLPEEKEAGMILACQAKSHANVDVEA